MSPQDRKEIRQYTGRQLEMKINTIEVANKPIGDSDIISDLEKSLREVGIENAKAFSTQIFSLAGELEEEQLRNVPELVHHHVTQDVFVNDPLKTQNDWDFAIRVDYKPGVTDNSARVLKTDLGLTDIHNCDVYTSNVHYVKGKFDNKILDQLERVASNPQIHDITILSKDDFEKQNGFERKIHPVLLEDRANVFDINLAEMSREELLKTGKMGTLNLDLVKPGMTEEQKDKLRGGTLSLKEDYLEKILEYSKSEKNTINGRKKGVLTDTELETIAQMWSEHCRHSLYNASFSGSKKGIFDKFIKDPTEKVLKNKPHLGVSIYKDNSGVFKFDDKWLICLKNETHNSPSALDPYGGAITGIVGVNRDPAGTGLGAEVIGNFLFYFLGHPEDKRKYYKDKNLENLLLNPGQIFGGVVDGVEKGGNQMGISINLGICQHHDNYNGKPIVGVGSIGRMPIKIGELLSHEKHIDVGDKLYIIGGRAGRDGIHGATFSSEELSANSPATAVQIGDPYTQRKTFEALLELRNKGFVKYITDLGAGGVSCAALEMAEETGGLDIDLDKLLIKYEGMTATEIFLNESQERMAVAVDENNKDEIEAILHKHEVEFSDIGMFTDSGRAIVKSKGEDVVNMDMDFIHKGFPKRELKPVDYKLSDQEIGELENEFLILSNRMWKAETDEGIANEIFQEMLRRPNLGSVAPFMDKMDDTVKGMQVQHCIQGKGKISTKTACTIVDHDSVSGLIQSYGFSERQTYIDAEKMGKNAFLRSIGNTVAMGGKLDHMVATDQALWQSSDDGRYQQMLIEANKGMAEVIEGCELPVISGKDSMYNQATIYDEDGNVVKRGVYPTLLMTTMGKIDDVNNIVTVDAKEEGNLVYVVGSTTKDDMGGSEYMNMYSEKLGIEFTIGNVSNEDVKEVYDTFGRVDTAVRDKLLQSSKYVEAGGLMTAINHTAMAGELGINVDLSKLHQKEGISTADMMYGETEGRFLVTIKSENKDKFEKLFDGKYSCIGTVTKDMMNVKDNGSNLISESVYDLLMTYHKIEPMRRAA